VLAPAKCCLTIARRGPTNWYRYFEVEDSLCWAVYVKKIGTSER
jgi:hypothetical protein